MKLRTRLSFICAGVMMAIMAVSCTLLIINAQNNLMEMTKSTQLNRQKALSLSFISMMDYYHTENEVAKNALAIYSFEKFAEDSSVLYYNDEILVSNVSIEPESLLQVSSTGQEQFIGEANGINVMITGSYADASYKIYTIEDIEPVYQQMSTMAGQFILIGMLSLAVGIMLLVFVIKAALRPLETLGNTVRSLRKGEYHRRSTITSKDELGELAHDFNLMAQAVEEHICELNRRTLQQKLFMGGVAHEFKTPMTAIILHSDTLLNSTIPEEKRMISAEHIHTQTRWLERLASKLLRLVTADAKIDIRAVDTHDLMEDLEVNVADVLHSRKQTLNCSINTEHIDMDKDLILSLLINLVDNAAKASEDGATIWVTAKNNLLIVEDKGCGMEDTANITEPFYTATKSRNKKLSGSGIGLALAQRIADAHEAKLEFQSEVGVGTIVALRFKERDNYNFLTIF